MGAAAENHEEPLRCLARRGSDSIAGSSRRLAQAGALTVLIVLIGVLAPSAAVAARARVDIGSGQIVVVAPSGARAIVTRQPFSLSIENASGRTVLQEVRTPGGLGALPKPIAPVPQNEFGAIGPPTPTLYAPLSFLVGTQTVTATPAGQWEGTLGAVTETGVEYSAKSVLAAQQQGAGVLLTLSTSDPTGRKLVVTVTPGTGDVLNVSARPIPAAGVATMSDSFSSSAGEAFHGFGGRHNLLDQHSSEFYNWIDQENVSSGSASGLTAPATPGQDRYMFPNGPEAAYYVQSSFTSSAGYGFLLNRDEISHWRLDSDLADAWQVEGGAPALDYTVAAAAGPSSLAQLTAITGRQPVPPSWAVGSILDREVKYPSDPAANYQHEVRSDIGNIDRYHVPIDAYRLEGWQELPKPILAQDIARLRARGIHPLVYFRAFVGQDKTGTDDPNEYARAVGNRYVATHADGTPYTFISNFNAPAAVIDFTNPATVRWWQQRIWAALDLGADGFMLDFGEQVLTDMHFHNGMTGVQMHNLLPVLYNRVTRDAIDSYVRVHPGRHIFYFTRAGSSGTPGDAAFENANFPGDETTDWTRSSGLASQTTDMLNRAIGGAYGFSTDIGGYFDLGPYQATTKELFLRWAEWAALSPMFRLHGSLLAGTHTPWSYDLQTVQIYQQLTALHLSARPLILKLWREAEQTGIPITRPLWLAYPGDAQAAQQDQEWLLGPDVLVAPVISQGAISRQVYFPTGCWQDPQTGLTIHGPSSARVAAPLEVLPYFLQCGTHPFPATTPTPPPARFTCAKPSGRLAGATLGPVRLGMTRARARSRFARFSLRGRRYMDFFCPSRGGIRVGYPSPALLRSLSYQQQQRVRGRAVLVLTANRHYALRGVRPGARLATVARRLRVVQPFRVGLNWWYLTPNLEAPVAR